MQGVAIQATGGTSNDTPAELLTTCAFWPMQLVIGNGGEWNKDCTFCAPAFSQCDDGAVALHSSCGHSRAVSYQDCNSTFAPWNDTANTYDWHGWWRDSTTAAGPYSPVGTTDWSPVYHTFRTDHSGGKEIAVAEYADCLAANNCLMTCQEAGCSW
jgi:hypothetical protein